MHVLIPALHRPTKPTGVCRHAVNLAQCLVEVDQVRCVTIVIGQWQHDYFQQSFAIDSPKIHLVTINVENSSLSRNRWFVFWLTKTRSKVAARYRPSLVSLPICSAVGFRCLLLPQFTTCTLTNVQKTSAIHEFGSISFFLSSAFAVAVDSPASHSAHWIHYRPISRRSKRIRT